MTREEALKKAINIVAYFEAHFAKSKEAREDAANIIEALEQEPCEDAISRQAVLKAMCDASIPIIYKGKPSFVVDYVGVIETVPSVNPQEPCDKFDVGNPCLYCKHEFEPQEGSE